MAQEIRSNMAGVVLRLLVSPGDQVSNGQDVVMLESMKMEIPITSEVSGSVKEIKVNVGDFVNEGDLLLELE